MPKLPWKSLALAAFLAAGIATSNAAIPMALVNVGNAGNAPDITTGYGAVAYDYAIGKYEVTVGQYAAFLNAVAAKDLYSLYNPAMGTDMNVAGIARSGNWGSYTYSVINNSGSSANRPISYVSWHDAARFANWMANGLATGLSVDAMTETGAFTMSGPMGGTGFTHNAINVNTGLATTFWIPSESEWYKAAYYQPNSVGGPASDYWLYPTQSNELSGTLIGDGSNQANYNNPLGTLSAGSFSGSGSFYGTFDQGGNVWEWNLSVIPGYSDYRGLRGGGWTTASSGGVGLPSSDRANSDIPLETSYIGFRLASIPEPSTVAFLLLSGAAVLAFKRRRPRQSR